MSELLELANQFRSLDDEALHALIVRRSLSAASKDFLDLAESALAPKSIQFAVATLTASQIEALKALLEKTASHEVATKFALETGLAIITNENVALASAVEQIALDLFDLAKKTTQPQIHAVASENLTPLAAVAAFETQQALTELILDAEQRVIRVVSRNAIGLPDIKRLALHLRKSPEYAKHCYRIAQRLGLIRLSDARWWLTDLAEGWLAENQAQRWLRLANNWVETLGKRASHELLETLESEASIALNAALAKVFPLAQVALETHLAELVTQAEWLGLAVSQSPTEALTLLLSGKPQEAMKELEKFLPEPKEFLLAQGDQSLIAPGPLPTATEVLLRSFADVEQVSLASTYRLSALSVTHGLEMGLSEAEIRACLTNLTQKSLPQPIDYLLADTAKKFGRITVSAGQGAERSVVRSTESLLLTEIHTDHRLKPYAFAPVSASALASRFEPEVIYYGLRENGFLAVLLDAKGNIVPPRQKLSWQQSQDPAVQDATAELVASLRANDARIGATPNDDDLLRQIQLAIKNHSTIKVELTLRDGSNTWFTLEPSSIANGRLRGVDKKADTERVLPMAQIIRIEF